MKNKYYSLITALIGIIAVWFFMYYKAGDSLTSCILITLLIIRIESMNLAMLYVGGTISCLETMFNLHDKQLGVVKKILGLDDSENLS